MYFYTKNYLTFTHIFVVYWYTKRFINKQVFVVSSFSRFFLTWPIKMTWISRYIFTNTYFRWIVFFFCSSLNLFKLYYAQIPNIESMHAKIAKISLKTQTNTVVANYRRTTVTLLRKWLFRFIIMAFCRLKLRHLTTYMSSISRYRYNKIRSKKKEYEIERKNSLIGVE